MMLHRRMQVRAERQTQTRRMGQCRSEEAAMATMAVTKRVSEDGFCIAESDLARMRGGAANAHRNEPNRLKTAHIGGEKDR